MKRSSNFRRVIAFAAATAATAVSFANADAASETTRRNATAIQNYQNQKQTPYYTGQTNPYYGTNSQTTQPQPNAATSNALQNQLRDNNRRNGR